MPRRVHRRTDRRRPEEMRPVQIEMDPLLHAEGSVQITMGGTRVLCAATVEPGVPPFLKGKKEGWVTAEYAMLPRSAAERIPRESVRGRPSGRTQEIQRLIGRSMRAVVDRRALGERTVILDCDVIQADGGTRTVSITGAYLALARAVGGLQEAGKVPPGVLLESVAATTDMPSTLATTWTTISSSKAGPRCPWAKLPAWSPAASTRAITGPWGFL